jgi:DNA ligase-1
MHNGNVAKRNALGRTERSSHKGNLVGLDTLGTLLVRDIHTGVEFSIGTGIGLNTILRKMIWEAREAYLGVLVKYRYFDGGGKDRPRFPTFHGFRDEIDL